MARIERFEELIASQKARDLTRAVVTALACLVVVLAATRPLAGMTAVKRDFPELVAQAELIITGTVTDIHTDEDATGTPMTQVTLSDVLYIKGGGASTLTLHLYGGTAGSVTVRVPDMPTFTVGERDVLFIRGNGHDICPLVGVWQGRFRVRYDQERGADVIEDSNGRPVTQLVGRELLRAGTAPDAASPTPVTAIPLTLTEFRQLITNELAHPQPPREPR